MRKILTVSLLIASALFGCAPDACEDVNCTNGTCDKGVCICEAGYEGPNCQTEQRLAFVGTYNVVEDCDLGDFNFDVTAMVSGTSITIDHETGTGATIIGSGELVDGVLTIDYTMTTSAQQTVNCTMICTPV